MVILGIETSCDETSAAVIKAEKGKSKVTLLSNVISSSLSLHSKTGGIIPEIAAREQIKFIIPVIKEALSKAGLSTDNPDIDSIAVTYGPGLIGSLLVGVETAKTLSYVFEKPLIPTNHLVGHIYANFVENKNNERSEISFPAVALVVSGGHTDLVLLKKHGEIKWLGGTRDDAAGEALDKIGRILGLPYPGGPYIEEAAKKGRPNSFNFPRPMIGTNDFDFSFSGLKTAVFSEVKKIQLNNQKVSNISLEVQNSIIDVLVSKTIKASKKYRANSILLSGGVSANKALGERFVKETSSRLFIPPPNLCTDNAAMIASAAFFNYKDVPWQKVEANPSLHFT